MKHTTYYHIQNPRFRKCSPETDAKNHTGYGALVSMLVVTDPKICL